ncbi:MAG: c-type cytochrome domain-containing protein [Planctomycetaceae bacterium]
MKTNRRSWSITRWMAAPGALLFGVLSAWSSTRADDADLAKQAYNILKENCHVCHGDTVKVKGLYVVERDSLLANRGEDLNPYVTPGSAEKSVLWEAAVRDDRMPPDNPLPEEQQDILTRWIEAGAHFPSIVQEDRPFISQREVIAQIADHLFNVSANDRRFQRYFSIAHLHNNRSVETNDLRKYRAAFSKVVNSLSRESEIVVPKAIDEQQTIFTIDLRDVGWDDLSIWDKVVGAYPYGLKPQRAEDGTEEYRRVEELYGQALFDGIAYMRADWFIVHASRPPLYHDLLDIPETLDELLTDLGIDLKKNLENNRARRGGVFESGVSRQNRLVEYHPSRGGFWISYDFKKNAGRSNLARFPLGPKASLPKFENFAFEHAGGEIIFSLKNGLSGYMLVDNEGKRIDSGPIEIVSDADETSGTPEIVNGISCMNCHKQGTRPFHDDIRSSDAIFNTEARDKIEALYAERPEMDRLLRQGGEDYLRQLEKAIGPFLQDGNKPFSVLADAEEPVKFVARRYDRNLDLETAARELGYADPSELAGQLKSLSLAQLGLGPLRFDEGTVKRTFWDSRESSVSVFQEAARETGRGVPVN